MHRQSSKTPPLERRYQVDHPSFFGHRKLKKLSKPTGGKQIWDLKKLQKKQQQASTPAYLSGRLQHMQKLRTQLIKNGEMDKALLVQQGIQNLQMRLERLKRLRNEKVKK